MKLNEIKEKIKKIRKYDDYTLDIVSEYLLAVNDCFSDYILFDEAFKRLIEEDNLANGIKFVKLSEIKTLTGGADAGYNYYNKCVNVDRNIDDEMYKKYIIFHELTHVLSIHNVNNIVVEGLDELDEYTHLGLTEAITEYLTLKIIEEKYNGTFYSGYEVAIEQLENVMTIIDEEDIINCYFFEYDKIDELISDNGFENTQAFNKIFYMLLSKEETIVNLRRREIPVKESDLSLYYATNELYHWYVSRYFPMDSLEKFESKLIFIVNYINQHDSLHHVDRYNTFVDILCDVEDLKNNGISSEKINKLLKKYGLEEEKLLPFAQFNILDSDGSDPLYCTKRTEFAIEMYNIYKKYGREEFTNICDTFFMRLYDVFFIEKPNDCYDLYFYMKIVFIGKFLEENPQYDFDEISLSKVNYFKLVNDEITFNDWFYLIKTNDNKKYIIFEEYDDGSCFDTEQINKNEFLFKYKKNEFLFNLDEMVMKDIKDHKVDFKCVLEYDKKSNYECIKEMYNRINENNIELLYEFESILDGIEQRVSKED